ncbi:MAG: tetratricopeptide repeat protein [Chloroflexi bacterium]|nr:tetratricopeptide repeat protein [Chloroflexota bacterium]
MSNVTRLAAVALFWAAVLAWLWLREVRARTRSQRINQAMSELSLAEQALGQARQHAEQGALDQAMESFQLCLRHLACVREVSPLPPDKRERSAFIIAHHGCGWILAQRGDHEGAIREYKIALHEEEHAADVGSWDLLCFNLAQSLATLGRLEEATRYAELSVKEAEKRGHTALAIQALRNLAHNQIALRHWDAATQTLHRCITLLEQPPAADAESRAAAYLDLGRALEGGGRLKEALRAYRRALHLLRGTANEEYRPAIMHLIGQAQFALGRYDGALFHYGKVLAYLQQARRIDDVATVYSEIACVKFCRGHLSDAAADFRRSLAASLLLDDKQSAQKALLCIGGVVAAIRGVGTDGAVPLPAPPQGDLLPGSDRE